MFSNECHSNRSLDCENEFSTGRRQKPQSDVDSFLKIFLSLPFSNMSLEICRLFIFKHSSNKNCRCYVDKFNQTAEKYIYLKIYPRNSSSTVTWNAENNFRQGVIMRRPENFIVRWILILFFPYDADDKPTPWIKINWFEFYFLLISRREKMILRIRKDFRIIFLNFLIHKKFKKAFFKVLSKLFQTVLELFESFCREFEALF